MLKHIDSVRVYRITGSVRFGTIKKRVTDQSFSVSLHLIKCILFLLSVDCVWLFSRFFDPFCLMIKSDELADIFLQISMITGLTD